eukprot:gene38103-51463_t
MEVFKLLPEGTLCEVINGQLFMSPSPLGRHQRTSVQIENRIFNFVENTGWGEMLHAPMDLYLAEDNNAVQPDIIIIKMEGNENHDRRVKKDLYEKFGVPEYFIIDPASKRVIAYGIGSDGYRLKYEEVGIIRSALLNHTFTF